MRELTPPSMTTLRNLARVALAEDIGSGDATTLAVVPAGHTLTARVRTRERCVVAGLAVVRAVFAELDPEVAVEILHEDGDLCEPGETIALLVGPARAILTGERTALNFLQHLSGIATATRRYVDALHGTHTRILDTRKTIPGLRQLAKYAVACGGGTNHRVGLYDRVMIKDNHLAVAALGGPGGIGRAVAASRAMYPDLEVEVEADRLDQVQEALTARADFILLDNMTTAEMRQAVILRDRVNSRALLEASGGITLERVPEIGATGVDFISVGALTHSVRSVDLGLDMDVPKVYPDTAG